MHRYKLLAIVCLVLALSGWRPLAVSAVEPGPQILDGQYLEEIFAQIVTENAPWPPEDLQIEGFQARPDGLRVPAGEVAYRVLNQVHANHLGKKTLSLAILVDGHEAGRVKMSGDLQLYGDVVCATRQLGRRSVIADEDLKLVRRNISMLGNDLVASPEEAIGMQTTGTIRAGGVLYSHQLEPPILVQRGDLVTILVQSERVRLTVPGEVRNPGALGELVRVKNLMSRKEVFARVESGDTVRVDF